MAKQQLFSISSIHLAILKSEPPQLSVTVQGLATSTGWTDPELKPMEKTLSKDGILDLDFIATPPTGMSLQVLTPITAHIIWEDDVERLIGVKVYSRTEDQVQLVAIHGKVNNMDLSHIVTTLAIGEEGGPTTLAIGEEGGTPTTFRFGEEGGPTTLMVGEEGDVTTERLGEEGKPHFGETNPQVDDPKPFAGETDLRVEDLEMLRRAVDPRFGTGPRDPFGQR